MCIRDRVHVHTNHPGKVLEEAITYGSLQTVKIENMRNQHTEILEEAAGHPAEQEAVRKVAPPEKKYGFVSVCAGDGISAVFRDPVSYTHLDVYKRQGLAYGALMVYIICRGDNYGRRKNLRDLQTLCLLYTSHG